MGSSTSGRKKTGDPTTLKSRLSGPSDHPSKSGTTTLVHIRPYSILLLFLELIFHSVNFTK